MPVKKTSKALQPSTLGAVRKARKALQESSMELLHDYKVMIKQAAAAGKYEDALRAQQWLLDHVGAEDGERIFDASSDKSGGSNNAPVAPATPLIQLNGQFNLGGLGNKALPEPSIEAVVIKKNGTE